jgi:primary-amine oxidase
MSNMNGTAGHPLTPLTPVECGEATALLKTVQELTPDFRFVTVGLDEPTKEELLSWPARTVDRRVAIVGFDRPSVTLIEAVVNLTTQEVVEWKAVPGAQPPVMLEEIEPIGEVLKKDHRFRAALHRRGIDDLDMVQVDPWGGSYLSEQDDPARWRVCRPLAYLRGRAGGQFYAHPIDGLTALFDIGRMEVVEVTDHELVPIPELPGEYVPEVMLAEAKNRPHFDKLRDDVAEISITEPAGPSWRVDGHHVRWQKWSVRLGWTVREGLVLHELSYDDRGDVRPVLHRAAISEMVVPYGDPSVSQVRKLAFDAGEVGLGLTPSSLTLGCDCLGEIYYFDGLSNDQDGNAIVLPNAICMHEEDAGIGWKHLDYASGRSETRRMQRLVLSSIANISNYEYGFFWYLYQDGSIELEVKLNGIMQTGALRAGESPGHGVTIAPGLYAPNHQHFFCARLDVAIDGLANTVTEVDSVPVPPGPGNPYGNAWIAQETPLRRESEAQRRLDPEKARFWRITNPNRITDLGAPTAYRLIPGGNASPFHHPDAPMWPRMSFVKNHLWVTPADRGEMYAGGKYPYQNPGPDGLPKWTQADRPIENADIAVWYVFGAHHVPRVEDWPVMPVDRIGFFLKPDGFFDGNPALDLPRAASHCHDT